MIERVYWVLGAESLSIPARFGTPMPSPAWLFRESGDSSFYLLVLVVALMGCCFAILDFWPEKESHCRFPGRHLISSDGFVSLCSPPVPLFRFLRLFFLIVVFSESSYGFQIELFRIWAFFWEQMASETFLPEPHVWISGGVLLDFGLTSEAN